MPSRLCCESSRPGDVRFLMASLPQGLTVAEAEETIVELVSLVAEEVDTVAGEAHGRLQAINAELGDVEMRLENLYQALETKQLLLPREALVRAQQQRATNPDICERYGVSRQMLKFRRSVTAVDRQFRKR